MVWSMNKSPGLIPEKSEICIIGGGIIGLLTALELAALGKRVVLLERGRLGGSQSSRNLGWVRQQGRARAELPIMIDANARWSEMEEKYGTSKLRFDRHSISYFGTGQDTQELYETYQSDLAFHGVHADLVSRSKIKDRFPNAHSSWNIGLQTPSDGRVEPQAALTAIADIARIKGVTMVEGCEVIGIEANKKGNTQVHTRWGSLGCEKLLICAGTGSARLLRKLGTSLPQLSIESTIVEVLDGDAQWNGSGSDGKIAFYRSPHGRTGLSLCEKFVHRLSLPTMRHIPHYLNGLRTHLKLARLGLPNLKSCEAKPSALSASTSIALAKLRGIIGHDARIQRVWAGEIDILPDFLPAIDALSCSSSTIVATGFSGHGFGLAPGVAKVVVRLLLEEKETFDISPFRINRFFDGGRLTKGPTF